MDRTVQYELMTPHEIVAAREKAPLAFIPIGPLEWHGRHLPLGTDGLHAHGVAVRAAHVVGGVVLPPLYAGTETVRLPGTGAQQLGAIGFGGDERIVGMDLPHNPVKSVYYEESAFGITVREVVRCLKADPFRLIVLLNGHGAVNHQRTLRRIAVEETELSRVQVLYLTAWSHPATPQSDPGHADKWETSLALAIAESSVQLDTLPGRDQPIRYQDYGIIDGRAFDGSPAPGFLLPVESDPRDADREAGERLLDAEVRSIVEVVQAHLDAIHSAAAD